MDIKKPSPTGHHDMVDISHKPVSDKEAVAAAVIDSQSQWETASEEARQANAREHELTVAQAFRAYPFSVIWSLTICMAIVMEGYATILVGNFFAYPTYAEKFGHWDEATKSFQIESKWQSAMQSGPQGFAFLGALSNGWIISRYGYKPAFSLAILMMACFNLISFFGMSVELQAVGQILSG